MSEPLPCRACGLPVPIFAHDLPRPDAHAGCLVPCADCGGPDERYCPCGTNVSLEGMAMADLKAVFARGNLSLGVPSD